MSTEDQVTAETLRARNAALEEENTVLRAQNKSLEEQLQAAKQTAEAAVRRERIMLANQLPPRTRRT